MGLAARLKNWMWSDGGDYGYEPETQAVDVVAELARRAPRALLLKPGKYVEAGKIARAMGRGDLVLLDLEDTGEDAAARILDFLSGAAYAKDGQFLQIASKAYLLVPYNVEVLDRTLPEESFDWEYDRAFNF